MIQGQVFLKGGDWHFSYLDFSLLHLEFTLPLVKLCYVFEDKILFSATIVL